MSETWRDIPGWEGCYEVSDYGRVRSIERTCKTRWGKRIVPRKLMSLVKWGETEHRGLRLKRNGESKHYKVHQLVAMAFFRV